MNLKRVTIKNFRNITFTSLGVENSNLIISGRNMSGKTNTLNAIFWAFTGRTMDGSADNRANISNNSDVQLTAVDLAFDNFTFTRECKLENGDIVNTIYIDGEEAKTIKAGEAMLHAKLGLTDLILTSPKDFNIIMFLLNPLYFETVSPSSLRKFFYMLSNTDFDSIAEQQNKSIIEMLKNHDITDPYKLGDEISKEKKSVKKIIEGCKVAKTLFPDIEEQATKEEKKQNKRLKEIEIEDALASRYALAVSKRINAYYKKAMGIEVCLLEKGIGEDVFKDVCYPILPKSKLPFDKGSFAEKTFVGVKFIVEVCMTYNIKPLPLLIDNMESLDETTTKYLNDLNALYIGARVEE